MQFSFRLEIYPILGNEDFVYQFEAAEIAQQHHSPFSRILNQDRFCNKLTFSGEEHSMRYDSGFVEGIISLE